MHNYIYKYLASFIERWSQRNKRYTYIDLVGRCVQLLVLIEMVLRTNMNFILARAFFEN